MTSSVSATITAKHKPPLKIIHLNDSNEFCIQEENNQKVLLKCEKGSITFEKFPSIHRFLVARKIDDGYEVLFRLKNGNFSKWIFDNDGYKQKYISLENNLLSDIEENFNVDLLSYCVSFVRYLMDHHRFAEALSEWSILIHKDKSNFSEFCRKDIYVFEDIIKTIYSNIVKIGDICVDGGANRGLHTLPLSKLVGQYGKVYAFEPLPDLAKQLKKKVEQNKLNNTRVVQKALGAINTDSSFFCVTNYLGLSGLKKRTNYTQQKLEIEEINVKVTQIDEFICSEKSWRFCKLDLEGGEFHALQGAFKSIRKFCPLIIFENGRKASAQNYNYTLEEWSNFFKSIDYKVFDIFGNIFSPSDWYNPNVPWYFIAVKSNSADEKFIVEKLGSVLNLRQQQKKNFDKVISLGSFCMTASQIRRQLEQSEAYILDWWVTSHESILELIGKDFNDLFSLDNLQVKPAAYNGKISLIFDSKYGHFYNHDFPRKNKDDQSLISYGGGSVIENWQSYIPDCIEKYKFLKNRWFSTLCTGKKILFARIEYNWTPKKALELRNLIFQKYPDIQAHFLFAGLADEPYDLRDNWNVESVTTFHVPPPNHMKHLVPLPMGEMPSMDWEEDSWKAVLHLMQYGQFDSFENFPKTLTAIAST
ncbi:MAG: FkbM family methyltransferase [Waterburya sp.]